MVREVHGARYEEELFRQGKGQASSGSGATAFDSGRQPPPGIKSVMPPPLLIQSSARPAPSLDYAIGGSTPQIRMAKEDSDGSMPGLGAFSAEASHAGAIDTSRSARSVFVEGSLAVTKRDVLWSALSSSLLLLARWLGRRGVGGELDRSIVLE